MLRGKIKWVWGHGPLVERKIGVMIKLGSFCTVINCMDGRTQLQVNQYLRDRF